MTRCKRPPPFSPTNEHNIINMIYQSWQFKERENQTNVPKSVFRGGGRGVAIFGS